MENNINVKSKFLQIFFCDKIIDELLRFLLNWRQLGQKQHLATVGNFLQQLTFRMNEKTVKKNIGFK